MAKRVYSVFNRSPTTVINFGAAGFYPGGTVSLRASEKSIVGSIFNRIAIDVSNNKFMHVQVDEEGFIEKIPDSALNRCLLYRPNVNQSPSQFKRDMVLKLCTEGVCAVVSTYYGDEGEPEQLQVGTITGWFSDYICVNLFNNEKQTFEEVHIEKKKAAVLENPLYSVMNDHASSIKRLVSKLNQLDSYTAAATSGKIQAFIGLDYDTSTTFGLERATKRREQIEEQMRSNNYGLVYHENTEKITFPNKPLDIDVIEQVKYLEEQVFAELGITRSVFTGEAKEDANKQYQAKTVDPFCETIAEGLTYMNISKDMYTHERVVSAKPMFSGITGSGIADMSDKLSRNAIVKSNEVRKELGLIKSDEAQANMLINPNMPLQDQMQTEVGTDGGMRNIFNQNDSGNESSAPNIFQ